MKGRTFNSAFEIFLFYRAFTCTNGWSKAARHCWKNTKGISRITAAATTKAEAPAQRGLEKKSPKKAFMVS